MATAYRPRQSHAGKIVVAGMAAALMICGGIAFAFRDRLTDKPKPVVAEAPAPQPPPAEEKQAEKPSPPAADKKAEKSAPAKPAAAAANYPRRLMAVSVNNYLYANPILFGSPRRNVVSVFDRLIDRLHVPKEQAYLVTDGRSNRASVPPIKPVVVGAIESFLATSRPQDQIVLLYVGHAAVIDGKSYLVPLDGELTDAATLIPLDWLYERLVACPARQKLVIFDACRMEPGRGDERPSPGSMPPELAQALKSPPPGVQVWASCSASEHSFEYKSQKVEQQTIEGGLFLNQILNAFQGGASVETKAAELIPIERLADKVNALTIKAQKQTPWLVGQPPAEGAAYDPQAAPPAKAQIPKPGDSLPGGLADAKLVANIFAEIKLPATKSTSGAESSANDTDRDLPFSATALKGYEADYGSVREILDKPDQPPLRVAVLRVVEILDRHGHGRVRLGATEVAMKPLMEEYASPNSEDKKKRIADSQRTGPAAMLVELEEAMQTLDKVKALRDAEPSKRWRAHYDYVAAMLKSRYAYVNEYNLMLGKIRKDELPPVDPAKHRGWRLTAAEKMQSPRDVKDHADEAQTLFDRLIKENPGTPWELLAKRERLTKLGLTWQPLAKN